MIPRVHFKLLIYLSMIFSTTARSQTTVDPNDVNPVQETPGVNVTVAVIDFESNAPGNPHLGRQLADILTIRLSLHDEFQMVERQKLAQLIQEHRLNLTGITAGAQTAQAGQMLGASLLIFGKAFAIDRDLYLAAKIVGTQTGRVKGVIAKGKLEGELSVVIDQLMENLVSGLNKWAPILLPPGQSLPNPLDQLKDRLAQQALPSVFVDVTEHHQSRSLPDPAAETEIKRILLAVGFPVLEDRKQADILITGEGLSEFGAQLGSLVSCVARVEAQATDRETTKVLGAESCTRRSVDLAEGHAAKTALQAAGRDWAYAIIDKIVSQQDR